MCGRCAASLPYTPEGYNDGTDFVEACVAPLFYEGAVRDALLRYKFSGVTAYAGIFGRLVAGCVRERLAGAVRPHLLGAALQRAACASADTTRRCSSPWPPPWSWTTWRWRR